MLLSSECPERTEMPLRETSSRKKATPFSSPICSATVAYHSGMLASIPSLPFHFGSSRSWKVRGRSAFAISRVL